MLQLSRAKPGNPASGLLWMDQIEKAGFQMQPKIYYIRLSTDWKRSLGKGIYIEDYTKPGMEKEVKDLSDLV